VDRGSGDSVERCLAFRGRLVILLTTERVLQGGSGLFLGGALPRPTRRFGQVGDL
jgi:hypothetical protein